MDKLLFHLKPPLNAQLIFLKPFLFNKATALFDMTHSENILLASDISCDFFTDHIFLIPYFHISTYSCTAQVTLVNKVTSYLY